MSCKMIDDILKWLKEHDTREDFSVTGKNRIQTLKFQLRCVKIFVKWVSDDVYLNSLRTWIKYVEKCLLQPAREGSTDEDLCAEALSSLSAESVKKKLEFECHRYFEIGFSILSFGLYTQPVQIEELVLDLLEPLLDILMHLIRCVDLSLSVSSEKPIAVFTEKLRSLRNFIKTTNSIKSGWLQSRDLLTKVKKLLENAVFASCNWWTEPVNERMEELFCCLVVKIKHLAPEIRMSYAEILKESKDPCSVGIDLKTLASVDSLLDNLQKVLKQQDAGSVIPSDAHQIKYLYRELSFVKYFLMDPQPEQYMETMPQSFSSLLIQVEEIARRSLLAYSVCVGQTKDQMADEVNLLFSNTLEITNLLKLEIGEMYQRLWKPSTSRYPQTPKLAFLDSFLQSLDELSNRKADSIGYVKNEFEIVRSELGSMRSFVCTTIKKTEEDISRRIVDVAYEAEHVIDLITTTILPNWYYMLWLSNVIEKINMLRKDLTEVETTRSIDVLNVKASFHDSAMAYTLAAQEEVVGFQNEVENLLDQLTRGSNELQIISIVGMAGAGKTAVAKKVYEHPLITHHFHLRSWCHVSQAYQMRELFLGILGVVTELTDEFRRMDIEGLAEQLYRRLRGQRYLIVLDDIWSIEPWDQIKFYFPNDNTGSRVLFTTQMNDVAFKANPRSVPVLLPLLTGEESWELLEKKVFRWRNFPPELYKIGKTIAKKCEGNPLSLILIAEILMKTETSEDHWEQILEDLSNQISIGSSKVLELAYKHLPDHLKQCFLYLGAFPEGEEIPTRKLVRLWLGEGFVQKTKSESLENAAEDYLMDLIARNLVSVEKYRSNGGIKSCRLRNILYDLSLRKAREEKILSISRGMVDVNQHYRHQFSCDNFSFRKWMTSQPYLRSAFFFPIDRNYGLFYDITVLPYIMKLLRVLDLEHVSLESNKLPSGIEKLVLLRYLAIQGRLKYVPPSVANLRRLQVLIIKVLDNDVVNLPHTLWQMEYLRDICINKPVFQLPAFQPEESFESSVIEKLSTPTLCHGSSTTEKLIRMLTSLRKLKCIFLNSGDNQFPVLDLLSKLETLNVIYHDDRIAQQPCKFSFPSNLKKLTLSKFGLPWSEISEIGRRLPKLEVLKLLDEATRGERWDVSDDEFCNLKFLKLEGLDIVEWHASPYAFPYLKKLVLESCRRLKEVPSIFVDSSLQMIEVKHCHESTIQSVRYIQEEMESLGSQGLKVLVQ